MTLVRAAVLAVLAAVTALAAVAAWEAWRGLPPVLPLRRPAPTAAPTPAPLWLRPLEARLTDAAVAGTAATWAAGVVAAGVSAVAAGAVAGTPVLGVGGAVGIPVLVGLLLRGRRGRRAERIDAQVPAAMEGVAAGLRSGATLPLALEAAAGAAGAGLGHDLTLLAARTREVGLVVAVDRWAADRPTAAVRLAATALALSAEVGGAGARALDGVAITVRQRLEAMAEVRALATQARLSAVVLCAAPVAFAAFAAAADRRTIRFLLVDGAGQVCLVAGLLLDVTGALWMGRITRAADR